MAGGDKSKGMKVKIHGRRDSKKRALSPSPTSSFEGVGSEPVVFGMWEVPFDVRMVPEDCLEQIMEAAPFLWERKDAVHTPEFFKKTLGLCDCGIPFSKLNSAELLPIEDLEGTYPLVNGRHPVRLIPPEAREQALSLYQRVFGGPPDNGEFSTSFIRGCAVFYQQNKSMNWASKAASLAGGRAKHPERNSQKLTPPALREQIQRIITILSRYRAGNCMQKSTRSKPESFREAAVGGSSLPASKAAASEQNQRASLQQSFTPIHPSSHLKQASGPFSGPLSNLPSLGVSDAVSPLLTARLKRDSSEKRLYRIMQRLEETEKTLADHHAARAIHEATEAKAWDAHSDFRLQAKEAAAAGNMEEKKRLDMELRAIQSTARGATDAVDACNATIETTVKTIASQRRQVDALQSEIGAMSEKIEELVIESSFVRPKMCLDLLPRNHTSIDGIKIDSPCPSCNRFFSDRACAPMSCGCLYHPHCMLKVVLATGA
jgi:hypothetical protein